MVLEYLCDIFRLISTSWTDEKTKLNSVVCPKFGNPAQSFEFQNPPQKTEFVDAVGMQRKKNRKIKFRQFQFSS